MSHDMDTPTGSATLSPADVQLLHKVAAGLVQIRGSRVHRLFARTSQSGTPVTRQIQALDLYVTLGDDGVYELTVAGRHELKMDRRAALAKTSGGRR